MINRDKLISYLHEYLQCDKFQDYAPNGLQVEGRVEIKKISTAVSASQDTILAAISDRADLLLVHHGYFWRGEQSVITGIKKQRLGLLLKNDLNLCAYHLPLDSHLKIGNNACLAKLLNIKNLEQHDIDKTPNILWSGELEKPLSPKDFTQLLTRKLQKPLYLSGGNESIKSIAWCSGAGQDFIEKAANLQVDAYLSGEVSERTYYQAKELKINYFACGHHATERFGIQALGEHLALKFNLKHQFIDSQNPV